MSWIESVEFARRARQDCDWELAHRWLEQALLDVDTEPSEVQLQRRVSVLNNFALLYRSMHDLDQARACLEQACALVPEGWQRGRVLANFALFEHRLGDLNGARKLYGQAMEACAHPDDESATARICVNLAWLHLQQNRPKQAETLLKRARKLAADQPQDSELEARVHLGMARLALLQKRLTKAEVELLQAIRVAQQMPIFEPIIHGRGRSMLAHVYSLQAAEQQMERTTEADGRRRLADAEVLFSEAVSLLEDWGHRLTVEYCEALSALVDHWILHQLWDRAERDVRKLTGLVQEMRSLDPSLQAAAWDRAGRIHRHNGKMEQAERAEARAEELGH